MTSRPFDFLARHYNEMTGFPARIDTLTNQITPWVRQWNVKAALDAGCGGGALMIALDRAGVTTVGLDASEPMLRLALANTRPHPPQAGRFRFCGSSHEMAGRIFPAQFDAVFTLGNSIIGAADDREMTAWLRGFHDSLRPGGHLLIQILNLTPFFLGIKTLIGRRKTADGEYVRTAVPESAQRLHFCAMFLGSNGDTNTRITTWQRWEHRRLRACVAAAGFRAIGTHGSLERAPFDPCQSIDVVISAQRP